MTGGPASTARELGRVGVRKILQRSGIIDESMAPLSTDPAEVVELLGAPWYDERLCKLAAELGRDPDSVRPEAAGYLREMAASLDEGAVEAWRGFSRWLMRGPSSSGGRPKKFPFTASYYAPTPPSSCKTMPT
jgi:glycerol-3-phosphate O-acyltransferase